MITYCLPAHTNGATQPLDVDLYGPFKVSLNGKVRPATDVYKYPVFDQFDLLHMMMRAYISEFTTDKVNRAFYKAVIFPVNQHWLIGRDRT